MFQKNLNLNCIYLNKDKKVCLEIYLSNIQLVYMRQEKSGRDCIINVEKMRYLFLFLANIQILKIEKLELGLYSINEKNEYISLDELIKIGVLATCSDKHKLILEPSKELVK